MNAVKRGSPKQTLLPTSTRSSPRFLHGFAMRVGVILQQQKYLLIVDIAKWIVNWAVESPETY